MRDKRGKRQDNREGQKKTDNLCNIHKMQKYKNYCNFSFIYDRDGLLNLKDSPTDKGEETFIKLVGKRVIVK